MLCFFWKLQLHCLRAFVCCMTYVHCMSCPKSFTVALQSFGVTVVVLWLGLHENMRKCWTRKNSSFRNFLHFLYLRCMSNILYITMCLQVKDDIYPSGWPRKPTLADHLQADIAVGNKIWKALEYAHKKRPDFKDTIVVRNTRK